jgi:hypothetical protein
MKMPGLAILTSVGRLKGSSGILGVESENVRNPWFRSLNRTLVRGIVSGFVRIEVVDQLSETPKTPWHSGIRATSGMPLRPRPFAPADRRQMVVSTLSSW